MTPTPQPQNSREDFCLSDKVNKLEIEAQIIRVSDVKEFIKRLKEHLENKKSNAKNTLRKIAELAGENLTK